MSFSAYIIFGLSQAASCSRSFGHLLGGDNIWSYHADTLAYRSMLADCVPFAVPSTKGYGAYIREGLQLCAVAARAFVGDEFDPYTVTTLPLLIDTDKRSHVWLVRVCPTIQ